MRGVVWQTLDSRSQKGIYGDLRNYSTPFQDQQIGTSRNSRRSHPRHRTYHSLIGLERYEDAFVLFRDHLDDATHFRFSASLQGAELLERLFPDGIENLPRLQTSRAQGYAQNALAAAYHLGGEPSRAAPLFHRAAGIDALDDKNTAVTLNNLSDSLRVSGSLREADSASRRATMVGRQHKNRYLERNGGRRRGLVLVICGVRVESELVLYRSQKINISENDQQGEGLVNSNIAERLSYSAIPTMLSCRSTAWELAGVQRVEGDSSGPPAFMSWPLSA